MAIGLIQYTIGRKRLAEVANEVPDPLPRSERLWYALGIVAAVAVVGVLGATGVLKAEQPRHRRHRRHGRRDPGLLRRHPPQPARHTVERKRVLAFIPMFIASAAFWSLYQQQFTVLTVYSDRAS